jgi:uncharacterized OB-fold protein
MGEPIKRIKSPVRLEYTVSAGRAHSRFLAALTEARLIGGRCSACRKVYIPLRSVCPTCAAPMSEEVTVADTGTVTTFCIVNVPFEGQTMKLPYVYASVLLDGADLPILHLIQIPAEQARMGVRVKAEWAPPAERRPTLESIRWFTPTGEPDAPFDSYKEHL